MESRLAMPFARPRSDEGASRLTINDNSVFLVRSSRREQCMTLQPSEPGEASPAVAPSERGKRGEILTAAVDSVVSDGFARTSMSQVARRAGVPRPLVQYYFPTREILLRAAIDRILQDWRDRYFPPPLAPGSPVPDITGGVERLWTHMHNPAYRAYRELQSAARTDPALAAILDELDTVDAHRRFEQAASSYTAFADADPIAFADARAFTSIFLEGLLQHPFGAAAESSTTERQLAMLSKLLTKFWAQHGVGGDLSGESRPAAEQVIADRADELIALLKGLSKKAG
jgi:AcrR family transcriptional regulator